MKDKKSLSSTILAIVLFLGMCVGVRSEVITLIGGDKIEGEVTHEERDKITVKRRFKDTGIYYTETISRGRILRIDPGTLPSASMPADTPRSQPAESRNQLSPAEQAESLASAIARYEKKDYASAGMELYRLINNTPSGDLQTLSVTCEEKVQLSLADLAAECHLQMAMVKATIVRLTNVTPYEKSALIPRLTAAYEDALNEPASPPEKTRGKRNPRRTPRSSTSQPTDEETDIIGDEPLATSAPTGPVITDWLDRPQQFDGDETQAVALARQSRHALSLLNERIRLDPTVKTNRTLREQLNKQRVQLMKLEKAALARFEGAATPTEKIAQREHEQRVREQMQQDAEYQAQWEKERLHKVLKLTPEGQPSATQQPTDPTAAPPPEPPK